MTSHAMYPLTALSQARGDKPAQTLADHDREAGRTGGDGGLCVTGKGDHAYLMSLIDGCVDACGNTEQPYDIRLIEGGRRCTYRCADCGAVWFTEWKDAG